MHGGACGSSGASCGWCGTIRVVGAERVPASGPVLLAANHLGVLDGPLMHAAAPRPSHLLVKEEMFRGILGFVLRTAGQLPVDRESGRSGLESARAVLKRGGVVGIFPEGNRGRGDAANVRAGVGWLAVHADAPVVPVALLGTRRTGSRSASCRGCGVDWWSSSGSRCSRRGLRPHASR